MTTKLIKERPLLWVASSKRDLMDMPSDIIDDFGYGLHQAQIGLMPDLAEVLKGFKGASILELKKDYKSDTFRAVYTVRFEDVIVVLHSFQKKSKKGIETTKQDKELIRSRLKIAEDLHKDWKNKRGKND